MIWDDDKNLFLIVNVILIMSSRIACVSNLTRNQLVLFIGAKTWENINLQFVWMNVKKCIYSTIYAVHSIYTLLVHIYLF